MNRNFTICKGLWGLVLVLSLGCSRVDVAPFKFEAGFTPEQSEITLGEPFFVTFCVTNTGSRPLYLETGGDYRRGIRSSRFHFEAVDSSGGWAKDAHQDGSGMGGFVTYSKIDSNQSYSERLFLPLWVKFDHAGHYVIHAERSLQFLDRRDSSRNYVLTNSGKYDFNITVLPANSNVLGKCIQELGERSKSSADAPEAAQALAEIDDERVIPYLLYLAEKYRGSALAHAIEGLGKHPRGDSTRALLGMLGNPEYYYFQHEVAEALANMKSPEAKVVLREALDAPNEQVRYCAAQLLWQIGEPDFIGAIKSHLMDTNLTVRLACARALVKLGAFTKGSNSPAILARSLDFANPSGTNLYNIALFSLIEDSGGPKLSYSVAYYREGTETEIEENKKALAAMKSWADTSTNSPNR